MKIHGLLKAIVLLLLAPSALAQAPGNRTYFGQDIFVASGQQIHNATCFFCSVQVEGDLTGHALVLFGSLNLSGQVHESATVIGGNAVVDSQARIGGDTTVLGGNAVYEADESLAGDAMVLGGHLSHVDRRQGEDKRRLALSPSVLWLLVVLVLAGMLAAIIVPRIRRRATRPAVTR